MEVAEEENAWAALEENRDRILKMFDDGEESDDHLNNPNGMMMKKKHTKEGKGEVSKDSTAEAAGVLPVAIDNRTGELWVLLGKESRRQGFQSAHTWCDFGGSVNGAATDIRVAVQELMEETLGALTDLHPSQLETWVNNHGIMKIMSDIGNKTPYAMYIVEFPLIPEVPQIFAHRHRLAKRSRFVYGSSSSSSPPSPENESSSPAPVILPPPPGFREYDEMLQRETDRLRQKQPMGFQQNGRVRKHWLEKDEIAWFRLCDVGPTHANNLVLRPEFASTLLKYKIPDKLYRWKRNKFLFLK